MKRLVVATLLLAAAIAGHGAPGLEVHQPRAYGHTLGDLLSQRIRLDAAGLPRTLPPPGRVDAWLTRWASHVDTDDQGARWLQIDYQVINSPPGPIVIALPALTLTAANGAALDVPAWPISIAPLTPPAVPGIGDLIALRPDRMPTPVPMQPIDGRLRAWVGATLAVLVAWAAWALWRRYRDAERLPFARLWHELRRTTAPIDGWSRLHHALNDAAGYAVQGHSLPRAIATLPYLQPLSPSLRAFFACSNAQHFGQAQADSSFDVRSLARALYEAEKRHAA